MAKIHGFNKLTLLDYPGRLAATIFLGSCNFRCPFCHNAHKLGLGVRVTTRNTLCEFFVVIAAVAKVSCKRGLWLVARVKSKLIHWTNY